MSLASSSEKSDIELSEEEERSSWENKYDYNCWIVVIQVNN